MEAFEDFRKKNLNEMKTSDINPFNSIKGDLYEILSSYLYNSIYLQLKADIEILNDKKIEYEMSVLGLKMLFPSMEQSTNSKFASLLIDNEIKIEEVRKQLVPLLMLLGIVPEGMTSSGI